MSNVLGTVVPIKEVAEIAHERGITVVVDGSQARRSSAGRRPGSRLRLLRLHRPQDSTVRPRIGVLYGRAEQLAALPPYQGGGEMIREVTTDTVTYETPPHRFEAGTPPIAQAIGLGAALDYMTGIGHERIAAHEADLARLCP